jgi:cytochrome P450
MREQISEEYLRDPRAWWRHLRESGPEAFVDGCPVFASHGLVAQVLHDTDTFSSVAARETGTNELPMLPLEVDPPEHRPYRRLLDPIFSPKNISTMEPRIRELVGGIIEPIARRGGCDFAREVSTPVPSMFFLSWLGLPLDGIDEFLELKDHILRPLEQGTVEQRRAQQEKAGARVQEVFRDALDERMKRPGNDLLSHLLAAEADGRRLTPDEILRVCYLLLLAGLDTTAAGIGALIALLADDPDARRRLVADPSGIPRAIEEMLRYQTIVSNITRITTKDVQIGGRFLPAGTPCVVALGAANTDPAQFRDPETVDMDRTRNPHLTFGGGVHRCLGSHLARTEIRVVIEEWHSRIPDYSIVEGHAAVWGNGPARSLDALPLEWMVNG